MIQTPIAIVGMAKSGESAERLLLARGFKKEDLLTFDQKAPAQFKDPQALMSQGKPKTLVVSPGVPLKSPWIVEAAKSGVFITSEINLACECLKDEKVIGVTGSLGKSTTVSLLGAGLSAFDKNAFVGGNLGTPFCEYAYGVLTGKRPRAQWVVLELSSYQLENCNQLKLDYSAITFLSANHMERYDSLQDYYKTKWQMIEQTKGPMFLNKNGGDLLHFAQKQSTYSRCIVTSQDDKSLLPHVLSQSALLGSHNQDNIALAAQIALHCHWPISTLQAMKSFQGLEHRLENLGQFNGIRYINDSKATAMDSVLTAVTVAHEYLTPEGKLHVLLGGRDKNLPWDELWALKDLSRTEFVFFGECRKIAQEKSDLPGPQFEKLEDALTHIMNIAKSGDIVLLSPGGTSLDAFKGFEDRGNFFKEKVQNFYSSKS
ncbi:UDP-N-acetylmuramoyl-L-alanine--D-glutamate ligase [Bdellovibrio sp. HCB337]|uniref:UDP-N-acetylmuramoyl-L-alanine--D-glutamate ligase n=1 Tax=Bdellovibrio sp. HCB337 TaxID=3394358 RepID=UPI0039A729B5